MTNESPISTAIATLFQNEMTEQADERRLAVCLKACEGLPTESLERTVAKGETIQTVMQRAMRISLQSNLDLLQLIPQSARNHVTRSAVQKVEADIKDLIGSLSPPADSESTK